MEQRRSSPGGYAPSSTARWLFASDVHLRAGDLERQQLFWRFLEEIVPGSAGLFILGDLFDAYTGGRGRVPPEHAETGRRLEALAAAGVHLVFLAGNRDFLVGPELPFHEIHPDDLVVELGGLRLLLAHGDLLCQRDRSYARARVLLRSRPIRRLATVLPGGLVRTVARWLRTYSGWVVRRKGERVTDLTVAAVLEACAREDVDALIAGHVHRERDLVGEVAGRPRRFVGLGDWGERGSYAELDAGRLQLRRFP